MIDKSEMGCCVRMSAAPSRCHGGRAVEKIKNKKSTHTLKKKQFKRQEAFLLTSSGVKL